MPITVASGLTNWPFGLSPHPSAVFSDGKHLALFFDGTNLVYATSSDSGATWSGKTTAVSAPNVNGGQLHFDTCQNGDTLYGALLTFNSGGSTWQVLPYKLVYSGGSITVTTATAFSVASVSPATGNPGAGGTYISVSWDSDHTLCHVGVLTTVGLVLYALTTALATSFSLTSGGPVANNNSQAVVYVPGGTLWQGTDGVHASGKFHPLTVNSISVSATAYGTWSAATTVTSSSGTFTGAGAFLDTTQSPSQPGFVWSDTSGTYIATYNGTTWTTTTLATSANSFGAAAQCVGSDLWVTYLNAGTHLIKRVGGTWGSAALVDSSGDRSGWTSVNQSGGTLTLLYTNGSGNAVFASNYTLATTSTRAVSTSAALLATTTRAVPAHVALLAIGVTRLIPAHAALLQPNLPREASARAALLATTTRAATASAALRATLARAATAHVALRALGVTRQAAARIALLQPNLSRSVSASAALALTHTRAAPASAVLRATDTRAVPASAALRATVTRTAPAHVALLATATRTASARAVLRATATRHAPVSAALLATASRQVSAQAALLATVTRSIPASVALSGTLANTRHVPTSAALLATARRQTTARAALLRPDLTRVVPADVALRATHTRVAPTSVALVATLTRQVVPTAVLVATAARLASAHAALQATTSRAVTVSARLLSEGVAPTAPTGLTLTLLSGRPSGIVAALMTASAPSGAFAAVTLSPAGESAAVAATPSGAAPALVGVGAPGGVSVTER